MLNTCRPIKTSFAAMCVLNMDGYPAIKLTVQI